MNKKKFICNVIAVLLMIIIYLLVMYFAMCTFYKQDDTEKNYTKFQDRMSMDWDSQDSMYLCEIAQFYGGNVDDRAYTILVTLNKCVKERRSIKDIVLEELENADETNLVYLESIVPDEITSEAFYMVVNDKFDNSYGATEYNNFNVEVF